MVKPMFKRGDTLVEVMLAVGIFCMVAVAVVAVMSGGTSSSQTALETTLAREEIDNQADALRFIHSAYVIDVKNGTNSAFGKLWKDITNKAINNSSSFTSISNYNPDSCDELYNSGSTLGQELRNNGFVIDPNGLVNIQNSGSTAALVSYNNGKFQPAGTYPHLIYESKSGHEESESSLIDHNDATARNESASNLYAVEGIYVLAVKDPGTYLNNSNGPGKKTSYYDFYIRTCWYGLGDQSPSTISTVIRLYNPDVNSST